MKNNLPALVMLLAGSLLIYSAYKDDDPRNIIFDTLGIKRRVPHKRANTGTVLGPGKFTEHVAPAPTKPSNFNTPGTMVTTV